MMRRAGAGVYVISAAPDVPGVYKIGVTTSIEDRFASIQAHSPVKLSLVLFRAGATRTLEQALHHRFDAFRLHGEWFRLDAHAFSLLEALMAEQVDVKSVRSSAPPRRATRQTRTLGQCELCGRNVQTADKFAQRSGTGRGKKGQRPVYRHLDCKNLVRR